MSLEAWHDLFVATAGAGSALAGLIVVALSVNIRTIIEIPAMTGRAASTVAGLVLIVVVSCVCLVPDQDPVALGVEIAIAAAVALLLAVRSATEIVRLRPTQVGRGLAVSKAALNVVPAGASFIGGLLVLGDLGLGLHVVAAAIVVGFATAVTNTWVLLVEVLR